MSDVTRAYNLSRRAHEGQLDKGGRDYFLHPHTVAGMVSGEDEKIVAYLHDVVEDTNMTITDLRREHFSEEVLEAINMLTKLPNQDYDDYIKAISKNPLAKAVKMADLKHNSDLSRIPNPEEKDYRRAEKYKKYLQWLEEL